jgi:hypothetical protein
MDLKSFFYKLQSAFDWAKEALEPLENRWLVFIITCILIILSKAAGAAGLSLLIALFYIMFFITLRS